MLVVGTITLTFIFFLIFLRIVLVLKFWILPTIYFWTRIVEL